MVEVVIQNQNLRVSRSSNEIMTEAVALQQPPTDKGRQRSYFILQVSVKPQPLFC